MNDNYSPVIKWSGSKRSQAKAILDNFPKVIETYYEPFIGGGSILNAVMHSDIKVNKYICSDINSDLINLYKAIMTNPDDVASHYKKLWNELNIDDDLSRKKQYFEMIRERLNTEHNPLDFMFIMRTTTHGMPRYNNDGNFNNSFHITRSGIDPLSLTTIIHEWSSCLNKHNVEFYTCSYEDIKPQSSDDFMYLDPPYANTKGMYFGTIDYEVLYNYLRKLPCGYAMSFDGKVIDTISNQMADNTHNVPTDIYTNHIYLYAGNSGFRRTIGKSNSTDVYESLYVKYIKQKPRVVKRKLF